MSTETREFRLPDLGEGLTEAEIVRWLVEEGQQVELNQPLVEVETEKALVEIPSPFAGVVEAVHGAVGDRVPVGAVLVTIRASAGAPQTGRKEVLVGYGPEDEGSRRRRRRHIKRSGADDQKPPEQPDEPISGTLATPPVRKLARDLGVDIDTVRGTGRDGRVTREDVTAAAAGPAPVEQPTPAVEQTVPERAPAKPEERIPVRAIRRSIAEKMVRSASSIPHVTEWLTVDATDVMALRTELQAAPEAEGEKLSPLPVIVKALCAALKAHPLLNSSWDDQATEIVVKHSYHVGIATDTDRGLLVPVVRDADQRNVFELSREIERLVGAARDGSIGRDDLTGSTITITNVGSFGMEAGTPIINYPECAILSVGAIAKRPWVVDGAVVPRDLVTLSVSFDHRIVDGAEAGRFLRDLADLVENPGRLFGLL